MVADFGKKRNREFFRKELLFKTAGVTFLIIISLLIIADLRIYQKKRDLLLQIDNYKKQIEDIKKSSQTLKDEIANSNNRDYLEKIAYEQLGQQRPGEQQIIFVDKPGEKPEAENKTQNFWDAWLGGLTGMFNWIKSKF